jgi:hypothetical protein
VSSAVRNHTALGPHIPTSHIVGVPVAILIHPVDRVVDGVFPNVVVEVGVKGFIPAINEGDYHRARIGSVEPAQLRVDIDTRGVSAIATRRAGVPTTGERILVTEVAIATRAGRTTPATGPLRLALDHIVPGVLQMPLPKVLGIVGCLAHLEPVIGLGIDHEGAGLDLLDRVQNLNRRQDPNKVEVQRLHQTFLDPVSVRGQQPSGLDLGDVGCESNDDFVGYVSRT